MDLSVLLAIYNEAESLPKVIEEIHAALQPEGLSYEIVCVDDAIRNVAT